ncbi:hypothetical protein GCM10010166_49490 [Couchioplanes caeruleus subsp. azureus]|nr:hypothetical protein GCM10010166_49490 [Couchioplanes caeruleus subsp. azureus]
MIPGWPYSFITALVPGRRCAASADPAPTARCHRAPAPPRRRVHVAHLPCGAIPKPVWLWALSPRRHPPNVDRLWQAFLRRFDIEHAFRRRDES